MSWRGHLGIRLLVVLEIQINVEVSNSKAKMALFSLEGYSPVLVIIDLAWHKTKTHELLVYRQ